MDREAWRAVMHGVTKSRTWLSDWSELNWTELNWTDGVLGWMNETSCAKQVRNPALWFHSDLIQLMAETCREFILTCQCRETPHVSFGNWPEMGKVCGPNSPFLVKLFSLFDHFITPWELEVLTWYFRLADFQGTCDLCCYCVLWLRSQIWIGNQEAPSFARHRMFGRQMEL